jgi:hypothetical protein
MVKMKIYSRLALISMFIVFAGACKNDEPKKEEKNLAANSAVPGLITSAEELKALSPDTILQRLKNGIKGLQKIILRQEIIPNW